MTEIRSYDYVNHPYERVRDALRGDALAVFRTATRAAASRAESLAAELRLEVGGVDVAAGIDITVDDVEETGGPHDPATRLRLRWRAARRPQLFPLMDAVLSVYPLTRTETQLDFSGRYDPPLGALGTALDAVAGRRVAEACVQRFVADVARHLRERLAPG
jgi:hypothetical protein